MKILVVEDNSKMGQFVKRALGEHGYTVTLVCTVTAAADALAEENFDLVILDLGLPDGDGLDLLRDWRESGFDEPVLILSARDAVADRVAGLNLGADLYLPKPFSLEELIANVRALLRRQSRQKKSRLRHRGIELDLIARTAMLDGAALDLTHREFAILEVFVANPGRVLPRSFIIDRVWASNFDVEQNLLDVYMSRLRMRIDRGEESYFRTVRGVGYQFG